MNINLIAALPFFAVWLIFSIKTQIGIVDFVMAFVTWAAITFIWAIFNINDLYG